MKKSLKKFSFGLVVVMCFMLAIPAFAPMLKVNAQPETFTTAVDGITIEGFKDTGVKGQPYEIVKGMVGSVEATVSVKNPYGQVVTITNGSFTPEYAGNYVVTYTHNGVETDLVVKVDGVAKGTQIAFDENSEYIIPSVINPTQNNNALKLTLPNAYVVDVNGKKIADAVVTTTVNFSGEGNATLTADAVTGADGVTKFDTLELQKDKEGTYTLTYKYEVGGKLIAFNTKTIVADPDYNNDFEFTFDYNATKPTTAEIGVEKQLPGVTAQNKATKDQVEVYYSVKAVTKEGETTHTYTPADTNNDVITFKDGAYYFTPVKNGDYVITYTVKNIFGKEATVSSSSFEINDVADTTAPTPVVTLPYASQDITNGVLDFTDAKEAIPTNTDNTNIILLPIWATDNANSIVEDNLTLYRTLKNARGNVVFDESEYTGDVNGKVLVFNSTLDMTVADDAEVLVVYISGEAVSIKKSQVEVISTSTDEDALKTGTYIVSYIADDKAGNGVATYTHNMVITAGFEDTDAPTVKFVENLPTAIFLDEEIEFEIADPTDSKDTHLTSYVAYKTTVGGVEGVEVRADAEGSIISYDAEKEIYTLVVSDNTIESVKVIAYSRDDSGNIGSAEQTVIVLGAGDTTPTTITNQTTTVDQPNGAVQGATIILPAVSYADDLVDYLNVEIIIQNGETYFDAYDLVDERDTVNGTYTINSAKFDASYAGTYTITYITTDAGNNKTILVYTIDVTANTADVELEFKGLPAEINGGKAELGEKVSLPIPTLDLDGTNLKLKNSTYQVKVISGPAGYKLDSNYFFTANKIGTYTLQYVAEVLDASDNPYETVLSKEFKIEVVDTTGPEFADFSDIKAFFASKNVNGSLEKGSSLDIPLPQSLSKDIDWALSYVTISTTNSSGTPYYLDKPEELKGYSFNRNATYTITYVLVDTFGNETKESVSLDVGDVEAPKITVEDDAFKGEYKIGDVITVDLSKIAALDKIDGEIIEYDEETKKYSLQDGATMEIVITNTTTGTAVPNDLTSSKTNLNFQFTITTAGEYTVEIKISDTNGKVANYDDISFTVNEETNAGMSAEEVLGTVLIVISVIMLAVVVFFFVRALRKNSKKSK